MTNIQIKDAWEPEWLYIYDIAFENQTLSLRTN